jgi:hypothetical protein
MWITFFEILTFLFSPSNIYKLFKYSFKYLLFCIFIFIIFQSKLLSIYLTFFFTMQDVPVFSCRSLHLLMFCFSIHNRIYNITTTICYYNTAFYQYIIFGVDIILSFFVTYVDKNTIAIMDNQKKILLKAVKTFWQRIFFMFPFEVLGMRSHPSRTTYQIALFILSARQEFIICFLSKLN